MASRPRPNIPEAAGEGIGGHSKDVDDRREREDAKVAAAVTPKKTKEAGDKITPVKDAEVVHEGDAAGAKDKVVVEDEPAVGTGGGDQRQRNDDDVYTTQVTSQKQREQEPVGGDKMAAVEGDPASREAPTSHATPPRQREPAAIVVGTSPVSSSPISSSPSQPVSYPQHDYAVEEGEWDVERRQKKRRQQQQPQSTSGMRSASKKKRTDYD